MKTKLTSMKIRLTTIGDGNRTCATTEPVPGRKPVLALLMRLLRAAVLVLPAFGAQAGVVLTSLHSFQVFPNGAYPAAALVQGSDGNFYGTTSGGDTNGGAGTVFKISTNGALTSLYSFTGRNDGGGPNGLVQGSGGYLYGTTFYGGTNNFGTVFKISTNGALTSLYSFTGGNDGVNPEAGLVQGNGGNFYGTTRYGGTNNSGTVFKISTNGALTSLYSFTGTNDGANPYAGLVQGSDGNFYGTTSGGGTNGGHGTVFKISSSGALTSLYSFTGGNDGEYPYAGLVQGSSGNFYGTTYAGGTNGAGTVFQISTNGALTSLYSFTGNNDGAYPYAGLVQGSGGNLYGTTYAGGTNGAGTVFQISTNGALTSLYSFTGGTDGEYPYAGLVQGSSGKFYGTTYQGGTNGAGTVFQISTNGALTSLYSFTGTNDGANPYAGLVQGSGGNFYGTTFYGGTNGYGTVFQINTNAVLTSLYSFTVGNDGTYPYAGLVQGSDGNFYGTTETGGTNGSGTVFKIGTNGAYTSLYSFTGGNDGAVLFGGLVQGSGGNFYGTTYRGGTNGAGTVFKISTNGALTSLYSFTGTNDGGNPEAGLVRGSGGNFYGTTYQGGSNNSGTVFKIGTNGTLTSLFSFTGGNDGANAEAGLVQGSDGNFYGTTEGGGTNGVGTVFKISANGALISLYSFTGGNDGGNPDAGLVQGSDGNFYGTTYGGGTNGAGTVFKISTNGALTSLYSFTGGNDGANAEAGLVQGSDGSFYGTTYGGGQGGAGTVFRLTVGPEPPELTIIPYGAYVILTWPTDAAGFTLEFATNLVSPAVWHTNLMAPIIINGENVVINPITGRQQFYRLSQ